VQRIPEASCGSTTTDLEYPHESEIATALARTFTLLRRFQLWAASGRRGDSLLGLAGCVMMTVEITGL
jgi:hypothetical protein